MTVKIEFEVPRFTTVDVHVNGNVELEDISIGEDDEDVTVTIDWFEKRKSGLFGTNLD